MKKLINNLLPALGIMVFILLWLPVILLIVYSFSSDRFGVRWEQFTFDWYISLSQNSAALGALQTSLIVAFAATIVSVIIGTFAAYGLFKFQFRGKRIIRMAILIPMILPGVVTGAALLTFFLRALPVPLGYPSIIVAHITFSLPLAVFIMLGRLQRMDWTLELAAMNLGANRVTTFRRITGPLMMPGIMASAVLIFPWSLSDFVITYFVSGVGNVTLPIYIYSQMRYGVTPMINAMGALLILVTIIFMILAGIALKKNEKA